MTNYLYSIRARHVADILNGRKTFELRKSAPKPPFVMWIYVTKAEPYINQDNPVLNGKYDKRIILGVRKKLNGLVVAKCVVDEAKEIKRSKNVYGDYLRDIDVIGSPTPIEERHFIKSLNIIVDEILDYIKFDHGYALHLTQLEILDKPLQVSEFYKDAVYIDTDNVGREITPTWLPIYPLTRAPQSYQKVIPPEVRK